MAKFTFRLDPVLRMREREERDRQVEVAKLEQERLALERRLNAARDGIAEGRDALRDCLGGPERAGASIDARLVRLEMNASLRRQTHARELALQVAGAHKRLDKAREALREASRRRRAIELLREHKEAAWRKEQARRESAALDEIAVMRAARTDGEML
ncbi:MAG: flagellar FliJ family protein [Phycisphaerales bacterium]